MPNRRFNYLQYLPVYIKTADEVIDQNYQGDSAKQISILIWLNYVPKIFEKQDLAVAKARVVDA
jgi:hypothetical protein